jgi:hypothetical protein
MLLLYRGKSFVSWRIKLVTLSVYSHAAWLKTAADDRAGLREMAHFHRSAWPGIAEDIIGLGCLEAWHKGGVRETNNLRVGHKPGTVIDIFDPVGVEEFKFPMVEDRLRSRVGESYWFSGVLWARLNRYRSKDAPEGEWFCSHLIEDTLRFYGCPTVDERIPAHGVWPGCFERSVLTSYLGSVRV